MRSESITQSQRGYLVETSDGRKGRTFHSKGLINGKVPVYLETKPFQYSDKGVLCHPINIKLVGFID